jgi:hypothetical protein
MNFNESNLRVNLIQLFGCLMVLGKVGFINFKCKKLEEPYNWNETIPLYKL